MVRRTHVLWLSAPFAFALVVACSTFTPEEDILPSGDAMTTAETGSADAADAGDAAAAPCDLTQPFRSPIAVTSLVYPGHSTTGARPAGAFLYFVSNRYTDAGGFSKVDLYRASFAANEFSDITHLDGISDPAVEDVSPTETANGLTLYFARGAAASRQLLRSVRSDRNIAYNFTETPPETFMVKDASAESDPYLVGDTLYFTAVVGTPAFYAKNIADDAGPKRVAHSEDATTIRYPVVTADEKELYYVGYADGGGSGVPYVSTRLGLDDEFPAGTIASDLMLSSVANVTISGVSGDGCDLYMSGNVIGNDGFVVFRARRAPP